MKNISIIAVILVVIGFGYYSFNNNENNNIDNLVSDNESSEESNAETMDGDDTKNMDSDKVMENDEAIMDNQVVENELLSGIYEIYSPEKLSQHSEKNIVLFFKADWCPSCRALDSNISENISQIPSDLAILEVDYDTATDLKRKYGVTTQHSLVQVDSDGNMVDKWAGGSQLEDIVNRIK